MDAVHARCIGEVAGVPVLMVTWVRYLMHIAVMTVDVLPVQSSVLLKTQSLQRQLVLGLLMLLSTVLFFSVLRRLPLAEATSLNFMTHLFLKAMASNRRQPSGECFEKEVASFSWGKELMYRRPIYPLSEKSI
jgi:threonine/homoserine efflux transporter RhtA